MKRPTALFLATLLAACTLVRVHAQEPSSAFGLTPAKQDSLLPSGAGELPLIPDGIPATGKAAFEQIKKEKKSQTDAAEDALRDRIKLREARSKAQRDPGLQALWAQGAAARTDYEQRAIWTDYYAKLYALMGKIDKSLKKENLDAMVKEDTGRYRQSRIAPTEPPPAARTGRN
jgi:hypothetical protein